MSLSESSHESSVMQVLEVLSNTHELGVAQTKRPPCPQDGALVQTISCGLCGSDLDKLIYGKSAPKTVLGHEWVGTITELGPRYQGSFKVGDRIVSAHHVPCGTCHYCVHYNPSMCRQFKETNLNPGGFSTVVALSGPHLNTVAFPVPAKVDSAHATVVEPLACVLRGVERAGGFKAPLNTQNSVIVVGLGFIGLLAAQVYKHLGYQVWGIDKIAERVAFAQDHQWVHHGFAVPEGEDGLVESIRGETPVGGVDTVFLTALTPAALETALAVVRDGGNLVLFSGPMGTTDPVLDLTALYFREINLIASYSPSVSTLGRSLEWIARGHVDVGPVISHTVAPDELPGMIEPYRKGEAMKVVVDFAPWHGDEAAAKATEKVGSGT